MDVETLKQRKPVAAPLSDGVVPDTAEKADQHPAAGAKFGGATKLLRMLLIVTYLLCCCVTIAVTQFIGAPLYWINKDYYYAYMALTKQSFGIVITATTKWWSPTLVRISGDASVAGQLQETADGRVECHFPDRMVMMSNHQIYIDWLYFWWIAYTNEPQMHGHIYIILKESLKYIPIMGPAMMFYGFIFMSRKMAKDQSRLAHRLKKLSEVHSGPMSGSKGLDPMWLMIFPEGTNISDNTKPRSDKWAEKMGIRDVQHQLLPRSTGMFFCLNELKGTVDYVYDCTLAYEGVPRGHFGQDYFTLMSSYIEGRPPKSVNMYWRRFAVADIPLQDHDSFDLWLRERWYEKDALLEQYLTTGRFPGKEAEPNGVLTDGLSKEGGGWIETEIRPAHWWEIGNIFLVLGICGVLANLGAKVWNVLVHGSAAGKG